MYSHILRELLCALLRSVLQEEDDKFAIVFAAMGVNMETAHFFKQVCLHTPSPVEQSSLQCQLPVSADYACTFPVGAGQFCASCACSLAQVLLPFRHG